MKVAAPKTCNSMCTVVWETHTSTGPPIHDVCGHAVTANSCMLSWRIAPSAMWSFAGLPFLTFEKPAMNPSKVPVADPCYSTQEVVALLYG